MMQFDSNTVGYRFHPTDVELVSYFLKNKMLGNESLVKAIPEVDVCKCEPWDLPKLSPIKSEDPEWFFFCARDFKYSNGRRSNRATEAGYWKATGKDRKIKARVTKKEIGTKKTLVFYKGRVPNGVRTNWVMHEYHPTETFLDKRVFVICRLKKKDDEKAAASTIDEGQSCGNWPSDVEILATENTISEIFFEPHVNVELESFLRQEFQPLPSDSANGNSDHTNRTQSQFGYGEEDYDRSSKEFLDSILLDGDGHILEEQTNSILNNYAQQEFLMMAYPQGTGFNSDTDNEAAMALYEHELGNSSLFDEYTTSNIHQQMRMFKESNGGSLSSKKLEFKEGRNVNYNKITSKYTPSIDCIDVVHQSSQYESTSKNRVAHEQGGLPKRTRVERRTGRKAVSEKAKEDAEYSTASSRPKKEVSRVSSKNSIKELRSGGQNNALMKSLKLESDETTGCSIEMDKNYIGGINSNPPSVYLVNAIVGVFMFVVVVREVVLYVNW